MQKLDVPTYLSLNGLITTDSVACLLESYRTEVKDGGPLTHFEMCRLSSTVRCMLLA